MFLTQYLSLVQGMCEAHRSGAHLVASCNGNRVLYRFRPLPGYVNIAKTVTPWLVITLMLTINQAKL